MKKPVSFTSYRPLERAENLNTVYQAYDGPKKYIRCYWNRFDPDLASPEFGVRVTDEFIEQSPGKAIMIGHGLAGAKTFGLDQPSPYFRKENARFLTYVITTSEAMIPLTARQSGVPESRVLPLGLPRTDAYFNHHGGGTRLVDKRCYLYAPTFRRRQETPLPDVDWSLIDSLLTDDEAFIVKAHPNTGRILHGEYKHVFEVDPNAISTPYLLDCAVLVTDYSSIMLDAHVIGKPVVLYEPEPGYTETRGMYLPYPDGYSSRYCQNERELVDICRSADKPQAADIKCRELTGGACDGHSTERLIELIRGML